MALMLMSFGLLLVAEGLLWALAPQLIEDLLAALRALCIEQRRFMGLGALMLGVVLVWCAYLLGA